MAGASRKGHSGAGARDNKADAGRVAAYARLSTEMQAEEGLSIIDILRMHTKKAKRERAREGLYNSSVPPTVFSWMAALLIDLLHDDP